MRFAAVRRQRTRVVPLDVLLKEVWCEGYLKALNDSADPEGSTDNHYREEEDSA